MRLVDTSAWLEFLIGSELGERLAKELPARPEWLVPTIVQLELSKWLTREAGEEKADQVIAFTETCVVADLDTAIALSAADLCARHKLAMADAVVNATALAHGADLLTCDRHFEKLPRGIFCCATVHAAGPMISCFRKR
jgi:predicted nucleic acid-binding protein